MWIIIFLIVITGLAGPFAGRSGAELLKVGGTGSSLGVMRAVAEGFSKDNPDAQVQIVPGLGSGGGRKALLGGALDVAVTARPWTMAEKLDGAVAYHYGRSPFGLTVSSKNPVNNLTIQDVIDIYSGKKANWPNGERLRLILRPLTDSDSEMLFSIGSDMEQAVKIAHKRDGMRIAITDEECADAIQSTPGAVGTAMLALLLSEKRPLKVLNLKGVAPSVKNIADGSYPWFKSFYLLTKKDSKPLSRAFVDYVLSPKGRRILSDFGHWIPELKLAP